MTELWVMIYYLPLAALLIWSFLIWDKAYIFITTLSMIAFGFTRLITEFVTGERYMFDFSNDLFVCVTLLAFVRHKKIVPWLIGAYSLMILFAYIPYAAEILTNRERAITVEVLSTFQLMLIFGGLIHGTRLFKHLLNGVGYSRYMDGNKIIKSYKKRMAARRHYRSLKNVNNSPITKDN